MAKTSRKAAKKRPRKYEKALSLYGMSFLGAVDSMLGAKPDHYPKKKSRKKR
jgi:hypothetical protein